MDVHLAPLGVCQNEVEWSRTFSQAEAVLCQHPEQARQVVVTDDYVQIVVVAGLIADQGVDGQSPSSQTSMPFPASNRMIRATSWEFMRALVSGRQRTP